MKKFTSKECLDHMINKISSEPMLIRKDITTYNTKQADFLNTVLWPAALDSSSWTRLSTRRPKNEGEGFFSGTDREVRTYENDKWTESGQKLIGIVTTENEEITNVQFEVKFN